jgi:hypothetical protein
MVGTLSGMAKKKRPTPGQTQGRSPAYTLYARIDPDLGEAFEDLLGSIQPRTTTVGLVELILRDYLTRAGKWPRPAPPPEKFLREKEA